MSKYSPPREKTSPIKVKDYFTNPLHKIKQSAFTEVSFSVPALSTFVRHFTYKNNSKYINLADIQEYIKKFSNFAFMQPTITRSSSRPTSISS